MMTKINQRNTFSKFTAVNSRNDIPKFDYKKQSVQRINGPHIVSNRGSPKLGTDPMSVTDYKSGKLNYNELNNQLKYPNNPAYFQVEKINTTTTQKAQ